MKLWEKGTPLNRQIEEFTVGKDRELDLLLAPYDVLGSLAHIKMLTSIGLLTEKEHQALSAALKVIYQEQIRTGNFVIEPGVEDVHSQIELMLTGKLGDVGKKIHSGRSRNDQVLLDLKLYIRDQIKEIVLLTKNFFDTLVSLSEQHKEVLLPGYTHLQVAMPSSFGLWFGAYAEGLVDDLYLVRAGWSIANQNPLGSAAGYGSSFPLDRTMTTQLLGFDSLNYNVVYAQMGRGKTERSVAFGLASLAGTLAKMAMDICLYNSQNFGFISFPDELTTGSSIMPHKKNPDVFELIRAKTNQLQALPFEISAIMANLPSGYHRDLQIVKESFLPAFEDLKRCLQICDYALQQVQVNDSILKDERYAYIFSVENVNAEVLKGMPFRDAYQKVGREIADGSYAPPKSVHHIHEGSIGNLCNDKIVEKMEKILAEMNFQKMDTALQKLLQ